MGCSVPAVTLGTTSGARPFACVTQMADLLYHSMVLLNVQGVEMEEVLGELRRRFGTSGIEEKASRKKQ